MPGRSSSGARSRASRAACETPSAGCDADDAISPRTRWLDGRRRRGGVPSPAWLDRRAPRRPGPDPRRCGRHRGPRPSGARPRRRGRPPRSRWWRPRSSALAHWTNGDLEAASRWYADAHGEPREGRSPLGRHRLRARAGRHPPRAGSPGRGDARPRARAGAGDRAGGARAAGRGGHARRDQRDPPRAGRPRGRPAPSAEAEALGEENGLPQNRYRSRVAMAADPAGRGGPRTGRSSSSTEAERRLRRRLLSGCAPGRRRQGTGVDRPGEARGGVGVGARVAASRRPTSSTTCTSSSTSPSPGCSWLRGSTRPCRTRRRRGCGAPGAPAGSGRRRRAERERHRDPGPAGARPPGIATTRRVHSLAWSARSRWPSRRATSASSSTKGPPMAATAEAGRRSGTAASDYVRRLLAAVTGEGPTARQAATDRAAQRTGARRPAAPGERPRRPGHRPRAHRVADHRADPHQQHLRQARREQPEGGRAPRRRARPAVASDGPPPHSVGRRPGGSAAVPVELRELAVASIPRTITPLITCADARSSHPLPPCVE